jgi:hypothetical protein
MQNINLLFPSDPVNLRGVGGTQSTAVTVRVVLNWIELW